MFLHKILCCVFVIYLFIVEIISIKYGQILNINDYPYVVSIKRTDRSIPCTGTVLNDNWILTAAHCAFSRDTSQPLLPQNIIVYVGSNKLFDGDEYQISKFVVHDNYNYTDDTEFNDDIALLKTNKKIPSKYHVNLCRHPINNLFHKKVEIMGWGFTELDVTPERLHGGNTTIGVCTNVYDQDGKRICSVQLVDGEPQISIGDSGGPMIYHHGRHGHKLQIGHLGGVRDNYMIYYNSCYYIQWINSIIQTN